MGLVSKLAACPASKHPSPIDCHNVDRPEQSRLHRDRRGPPRMAQWNARFAPTKAMECTVLRVPCIPSGRRCGFWRSSVRSVEPPPTSRSLAFGTRLPLCSARLANDALALAHLLHPEPVALRDARTGARTRSGQRIAVRSASARRDASPYCRIAAADAPARPLITVSSFHS